MRNHRNPFVLAASAGGVILFEEKEQSPRAQAAS